MTEQPNEPTLSELLLRTNEANEFVARVQDEAVRNLLRVALAQVARRVILQVQMSHEEWRARLPQAPFDMLFYVTVLAQMFDQKELVQGILEGKSVEQASGWGF